MHKVTIDMCSESSVFKDYFYLTLDETIEKNLDLTEIIYNFFATDILLYLKEYCDIRIIFKTENVLDSNTIFISNPENLSAIRFTELIHELNADWCNINNSNWMRIKYD